MLILKVKLTVLVGRVLVVVLEVVFRLVQEAFKELLNLRKIIAKVPK